MTAVSSPRNPARARVSEYFNLNRQQYELDFVDVDIWGDVPLYIDPGVLRHSDDPWAQKCVSLLQDFFAEVLNAIHAGNRPRAQDLLRALREPNDTHLGQSKNRARGRAVGSGNADKLINHLQQSDAALSGLLTDLEDTALLVPGVASDVISDMTTNIIRGPLIEYTQMMCRYYGIPMRPISSGLTWEPRTKNWAALFVELPQAHGRLLLVPKTIVRRDIDADQGDFFVNYMLDYLEKRELRLNTELVHTLKDGRRKVNRTDLRIKYGSDKAALNRLLSEDPSAFKRYKTASRVSKPLSLSMLSEHADELPPNYNELLEAVVTLSPGHADADRYVDAIERLFTATLYPALRCPRKEFPINDGRKRIDLSYTNDATEGFFGWLQRNYPSGNIFFECKNYSREVANPELDQLAGRFSPTRGRVGFLVCRSVDDKERLYSRCRDFAISKQEFIIPIEDADLTELVEALKNGDDSVFAFFKTRFDKISM